MIGVIIIGVFIGLAFVVGAKLIKKSPMEITGTEMKSSEIRLDNLVGIVNYMESQGLRFSSNHSADVQNQYAILGGKTGVGFRKQAKDGVNGIIFYCFRDKVDCNRFVKMMDKEVYPNSESSRPYKIQITEQELDKAIEILKMNPKNKKL